MITDREGSVSLAPLKVARMLTLAPEVIFPATPVAASIMMAISCSPGCSCGRSTNMSAWSSEPFFSVVRAILSLSAPRSVTAVSESHRLGILTSSNCPAASGLYGAMSPLARYATTSAPTLELTSPITTRTPAKAPRAHRTDRSSRMTPRRWREFMGLTYLAVLHSFVRSSDQGLERAVLAGAGGGGAVSGAAQNPQRSPMSSRPHQRHSSRRTDATSW